MINTSNEYKNAILKNRTFYSGATINFPNATSMELTSIDFMENGLYVDEGTSGSGSFDLGSAVVGQLTMTLNNFSGKFTNIDFTDAVIIPKVGLQLSASIETLSKGKFLVDSTKRNGLRINIIAFDNMAKFDVAFSEVSLSYPITQLNLLQAVCSHCEVPLASITFLNQSLSVDYIKPDTLTCRDIVSYIAANSGNYAKINRNGALELKWYDLVNLEKIHANTSLYNKVSNGDFSNGTTNWSASESTISAQNNELKIAATGSKTYAIAAQNTLHNANVGNKIYIKMMAKVTNSNCLRLNIGIDGSTAGTAAFVRVSSPIMNEWYMVSGILSVLSDYTGKLRINISHNYQTAAIASGKEGFAKEVLAIDLTELFGAGNEPDQAWCDKHIDFLKIAAAPRNTYHDIISLAQAPVVEATDVVITGVQAKDNTEEPSTVLFGSTGYILQIENPLIQSQVIANTVVSSVGAKIVGMKFRALQISALSNPEMEAGDLILVLDSYGNRYPSLITNMTYSTGLPTEITCDAETVNEKKVARYSAVTKAIIEARALVKVEKTERELAIEYLTSLIGDSGGLFQTVETLPDSSKIFYMHDKPTIAESDIIWKMTAEAMAVSVNGGVTYSSGMTATGDVVAQRLSVVGVNANWINAGTLSGRAINNGSGKFTVDEAGNVIANSLKSTNAEITGGKINIVSSSTNTEDQITLNYGASKSCGFNAYRVRVSDGSYYSELAPLSLNINAGANSTTQIAGGYATFSTAVKTSQLNVQMISGYTSNTEVVFNSLSLARFQCKTQFDSEVSVSAGVSLKINYKLEVISGASIEMSGSGRVNLQHSGNTLIGGPTSMLGFFGTTAVSKQTISTTSQAISVATASNYLIILNNILNALRKYNLVT